MDHPGFWTVAGPLPLSEIAVYTGSEVPEAFLSHSASNYTSVRALDDAGPSELSFFDNRKYLPALLKTNAGAVFVASSFVEKLPPRAVPLVSPDPYRAFAKSLELFYPDAGQPKVAPGTAPGLSLNNLGGALIAPCARIEEGAVIELGAMIGPEAQIGAGTRVSSGAVVGYRSAIGRDCFIGPNVSVTHSLIGNRVTIHAGARLGQDGFGFAMSAHGHYKVRQIGRVIVQDDVEIGANTTVDRGALRDTIIGEGTKIDNLVQIAHNVVIGRHCVIVAQVGISGSTVLEDYVVIGGQAGLMGHLRIGTGVQIGAQSGVMSNIPAGQRWVGSPSQPFANEARQQALIKLLLRKRYASPDAEPKT